MPLRCRLFSGDPKLEACLVQDSAHVTLGTAGDHVRKIQNALLLVDNSDILAADLFGKRYGPSTANAVLAYKTKRKIINFKYQTKPDSIVGKMTIAALDLEVAGFESRNRGRAGCGDGLAGGGSGGGAPIPIKPTLGGPRAFSSAPRALTTSGEQIFPKTLSIHWSRTAAASASGNLRLFTTLLPKAGELVVNFGMLIVNNPDALSAIVPNSDIVEVTHLDGHILRKAAEKAFPGSGNVLRVIVCPFRAGDPAFAFTSGRGFDTDQPFENYILLNSNKTRADNCTLIHEMVHVATNLPESRHDTDKDSVFSIELARSVLRVDINAVAINRSFFAG